jgi:nucleotide-binding universal stress UspA family protein
VAALPYAGALARQYESKVYLTHVLPTEPYPCVSPETMVEMLEQITRAAESQLRAVAESEQIQGVPHEMLLQQGALASTLLEIIKRHKVDLVVLGTHGRRGLKRFLLGSIAEEVFRNSPCPVQTVGPHIWPPSQQAIVSHRILYRTDLSEKSFLVAPYAMSLATEYSASPDAFTRAA